MIARLCLFLLVACSLIVLEGCATTQSSVVKKKKKSKKKAKPPAGSPIASEELDEEDFEEGDDGELTSVVLAEGKASFYHDSLSGRVTANGEKYNPDAPTCAHKSLPFGSIVLVEDVETGRRARCRVNDRGPYVEGRIIDLSKRVARELGIVTKGVARVRIRVTKPVTS